VANLLAMSKALSIRTLREQGWSFRRIARELGIDRDTVRRHVEAGLAGANAAREAPIGSGGGGISNTAKAPIGSMAFPGGGEGRSADASDLSAGPVGAGAPPAPFVDLAPLGRQSSSSGRQTNPTLPLDGIGLATTESSVAGQTLEPVTSGGVASPPSRSECEPLRDLIIQKLKAGLSSQRIYQDLVGEHGFAGKYWSVRRFVRRLEGGRTLPFRRMECQAGAEAQVDFGSGAMVIGADGRRRRPHVLRIVLSHSRKGYSEAVWRQTTDEFIRCLENAFWHFGGVPRTLVIDNLKAAVTRADWFDPELCPKVRSFARHYGTAILPTKPYTPRHKGKIENGVAYVKGNALKGRQFSSLEEHNRHLLEWETQVADQRLHGTTRQQVGKVFREAEKPALLPLPPDRFPCFQEGQRSVHRDGHVEVAQAYYSVPPEYLGHQVWVRWDGRTVRIFNLQMAEVALHARKQPGQFSTMRSHLLAEKISGVERGAAWLLEQASKIGPQAGRWATAMLKERGVEGMRPLMGLRSLGKRYPLRDVDRACGLALSYGDCHLRTVRQLIERHATTQQQPQFEFATEHTIIRPLSDYGQIARASLGTES
jgi:transposase